MRTKFDIKKIKNTFILLVRRRQKFTRAQPLRHHANTLHHKKNMTTKRFQRSHRRWWQCFEGGITPHTTS